MDIDRSTLSSAAPSSDVPGSAAVVLDRVVAEWRAARTKLGLSNSATVLDVAAKLGIDRGTAQRLNRISKLANLTAASVEFFPGVRAWTQILAGVERVLGAESPSYQTLSLACDHFAEWIRSVGGSRSAAMRQTAAPVEPASDRHGLPDTGVDSRAQWVRAAADIFGCLLDVRLHTQFIRYTPGTTPARLDVASLDVLRNCNGRAGCMPLAFSRASFTPDHQVLETGGGEKHRSFYILRNGTSKPAPATLSTGNASRQTVFVEPQWASSTRPLDLALLHEERAAMDVPWGTANEWLEFATINRFPCWKMILEILVCRDIDAKCDAALRVFRSHTMMAHEEPWFDRIPENAAVHRVGTFAEALADEPLEGYAAVMNEAIEKTKWDADDLIVYRTVIENPIPLATYTMMFDLVRP